LGLGKEPSKEKEEHILVEELAHTFLAEQGSNSPALPHEEIARANLPASPD